MEKAKGKKVGQSFAAGALIMAIGMLLVKVAGAVFKVPLTYILGGEGYGYFSGAYSIYNPIYALATAGLPIAVARMVSGDMARGRYKDVKRTHKISIPIFTLTGAAGCILMMLASFVFVQVTNAPGSFYSILMLAPTVFFSCLISIYKGYCEGLRNMIPTAVSEVVEAVGKIVFGLSLAYGAVTYGMNEYKNFGTVFGTPYETEALARNATLPIASAGAVLGITLGAVAGFLYIFIKYKMTGDGITQEDIENSPDARPTRVLVKMLLKVAFPIALGAIVMNLAWVVDTVLVQRRLHDIMLWASDVLLNSYNSLIPDEVVSKGTTHVFLAGCFGYMNTIAMLLPTITQGLAISALPAVTAAWVHGIKEKIQKSIETVLKITTIVSFPAGLGLSVLSFPIMDLIYNTMGRNQQLGEISIAAEIMVIYGIAVMFIATSIPICSLLQAVGRADLPVKILTVGLTVKVALNYILVGIPEINIQGAGIGSLMCYFIVCTLAFWCLCKETKIVPNLVSIFVKPMFCSLLCAAAAYSSHGLFSRVLPFKLATILAIALAVIVYALALLLSRTVSTSDLITIPKCKKIVKILEKCKLIH